MPKVLLVAHWDWVLQHYRMPIARALRDAGCDVALVSPPGPFVERIRAEGFVWHRWDVERRGLNPVLEAGAVRRLAALYRGERPDVAHHFTVKPNLYGGLAARAAGVPHTLAVFSGLGYVFSGDAKARAVRAVALPLLRRALARPGAHVLTLNRPDLDGLVAAGVTTTDRSRIVAEGIDVDRFHPPTQAPFNDPPVALLAARLVREKGVHELVEAHRLLQARGVSLRVRVAGEPDTGNPNAVRADELARWEAAGIEVLGRREDIPELLRQADIGVFPTHYREGIPWFLLEAGATALPVVSTRIGGVEDIVVDGVTGLLVPTQDPAALADALGSLVSDPATRHRMGAAARDRVVAQFSEARVVAENLAVYRDLGVL